VVTFSHTITPNHYFTTQYYDNRPAIFRNISAGTSY